MPSLPRKAPAAAAVAAATAMLAIGGAPASTAKSAPRCRTPHLVVWLNARGGGTAGSVYYHLELTNLSGHTCTLRGAPGVSAVTLVGKRIGRAASHGTSGAATVTLGEGKTASALLRVVDAGNFPPARCRPALAAGLRVYPPGDSVSKVVPFFFRTCRRTAVTVLMVKPVTSGRG